MNLRRYKLTDRLRHCQEVRQFFQLHFGRFYLGGSGIQTIGFRMRIVFRTRYQGLIEFPLRPQRLSLLAA